MGCRSFYLYQHTNGILYAEIMDQRTGARIASRSTGTRSRDEAVAKVTLWLRDGLPMRNGKRRAVEAVSGFAGIVKAIAVADLNADEAVRGNGA